MKKLLHLIIATLFASFFIISVNEIEAQTYRILPLGNSITEGYDDSDPAEGERIAYRKELHDQLVGGGYNVDFVGHNYSGYNLFSDADHGGIGGSRAQYVVRLLQDGFDLRWLDQITPDGEAYLDVYPADVILLHIGTNDITHGEGSGAADVENILDEIDAWEASTGTNVAVFVARILKRTDDPVDSLTTIQFNNNVASMITGRGDPSIIMVDIESGAGIDYTTELMADGIHPFQSAHDKMGQKWYEAIAPYLNTLPDPPVAPVNLTFGTITVNSIQMSWTDNSDNENRFEIYRSLTSGGTYMKVGTTGEGVTTFTDDELSDDTEYFYRVYAANDGGLSTALSRSATTLPYPPATPINLTFGTITVNSIQMSWTDNSDNEDGFEI
ncbi:MAG: fibronectin type III domain-containing protein, partial [Bacteroidales bacterium]|nr:fibronectin type III domain-containing protein [Bacteroidales bacterium]